MRDIPPYPPCLGGATSAARRAESDRREFAQAPRPGGWVAAFSGCREEELELAAVARAILFIDRIDTFTSESAERWDPPFCGDSRSNGSKPPRGGDGHASVGGRLRSIKIHRAGM